MEFKGPYEPCIGSDNKWTIRGPGNGIGYHAGTLWPHLRCADEKEAERMAEIANMAYMEGQTEKLKEIQKTLGLMRTR